MQEASGSVAAAGSRSGGSRCAAKRGLQSRQHIQPGTASCYRVGLMESGKGRVHGGGEAGGRESAEGGEERARPEVEAALI